MSTRTITPTPSFNPPAFQDEVLTVSEVASLLKMTPSQIYSMTRVRGQVHQNDPLPTLRINGNLRFLRSQIQAWLNRLGGVQ